jgi:hypothetical protein
MAASMKAAIRLFNMSSERYGVRCGVEEAGCPKNLGFGV